MDANKYIKNNLLNIHVTPNSNKNEIIGFDENRNALKVRIAAQPDKDKANKEIIKFFSKLLGKRVEIAHGLRSKEKVLRIY